VVHNKVIPVAAAAPATNAKISDAFIFFVGF